jgi:CheY-like chemotaxis protein
LSVKRALSNFLDNAILYTSGCENPSVFFEIKKSNENYVEFTVKDNGVGMSPDVLKKIGELGYRANNSKSSGSGTGLYSSIELIESMGGKITIESAGLGLGSKFSFTLPIFYKDKLLEEKEIEKRKFDRASRVLVVEDCEFNSKAIEQALLGIFEMPITVVKNGEDAVKAFNNEPYDLILMDTNLETAMTGTYATSEIRKHPINQSQKRPIIISVSGDVLNYKGCEIDGCYPKPVFPKHMRELFHKYFEIG